MRILVVESDRATRQAYLRHLERAGHVCHWSVTTRGAIDLIHHEQRYDLVLLSYELDGTLTGLEVAHYVARVAKRSGISAPAIFLVAEQTREEIVAHVAENPLEGISFLFERQQDESRLWAAVQRVADAVARTE